MLSYLINPLCRQENSKAIYYAIFESYLNSSLVLGHNSSLVKSLFVLQKISWYTVYIFF